VADGAGELRTSGKGFPRAAVFSLFFLLEDPEMDLGLHEVHRSRHGFSLKKNAPMLHRGYFGRITAG
jgi:hypothetical protein